MSSLKDKAYYRNWVSPVVLLSDAEAALAEVERERDELARQRGELAARVIELQGRLDHTQYWYGTRHETLWHWAHRELDERQRRQYFGIVANGSASPLDPPTYAQQFNQMKHRAERAEAELEKLRASRAVSVASDSPTGAKTE